jgi:dTDP-4-dehydrorhamnose reductase
MQLLQRGVRGVWHVTDGGECSWYEFAAEIARNVARGPSGAQGASPSSNKVAEVLPCTSDEFPRPAKRPAYSVLDIDATSKAIGVAVDWKLHLADVMGRM